MSTKATETAISRRAPTCIALALALALALAQAGCGGTSSTSTSHTAREGAFSWLRPAAAPAGWSVARIPGGAAMYYPPGWKRIKGDPGTASAASFDTGNHFVGYLNLTPRQGRETLGDWSRFRVEHNADENDRDVKALAAATGLRFRDGRGSCVRDSYVTSVGIRYIELACLVQGTRSSTVIVGASPPANWAQISPLLERAISSIQA